MRPAAGHVSWYTRRMRDLFDSRSFCPSRRALTQHLSASPLRRLDPFDVRTFGAQPSDRQLSRWRQRLVIIIGVIAVAYLALVFGLLVGAGISPWT
jgi:hypothetical protein